MKVKVRAVIFDFGHVLSLPPRRQNMAWLAEQCGLEREEFLRGFHELRPEVDRGTLPIAEFWTRMARRGGRTVSGQLLLAMEEADLQAWTQPNREMLAWADQLRQGGWATAILSNMPPAFMPWLEEHYPQVALFRPAVFSCRVGMIKPEAGIYRHCLQLLGLPAARTLFLDDMSANVAAARSLGMRALEFRSMEGLRRELAGGFQLPVPQPVEVEA
jgi:putative hydrolase of the HAD superfamily